MAFRSSKNIKKSLVCALMRYEMGHFIAFLCIFKPNHFKVKSNILENSYEGYYWKGSFLC